MKLETIPFQKYEKGLPQTGKHILSQIEKDTIIVYQAFRPAIGNYAIEHQKFGGTHYSFDRMSWIKPNFLWMMYRSGWASKEGQERILAIKLKVKHFVEILSQAIHSSFDESVYGTHENWKEKLTNSLVRLQWDPDHAPNGEKLDRRAIQLGLQGEVLRTFNEEWIISIEDISNFVQLQKNKLDAKQMVDLEVIKESVLSISGDQIKSHLGLDEF